MHDIPLPRSGYWSKLKFNKKVVKTKLPKQSNNPEISLEKTNTILYKGTHLSSELTLRKEIGELKLTVPEKLSNPHKYITATKNYHEKLKIRNKRRDWRMHLDTTDVVSIDVSDKLFSRALRFMDTR